MIVTLDDGSLGAESSKGSAWAGSEEGDAPDALTLTDHEPVTDPTEDAV
jgi:hypothetical protein